MKLFYNLGCTPSLWLHFWELIRAQVTQCLSLTKVSHWHWLSQDLQEFSILGSVPCCLFGYLWVWSGIFHPAPCWDFFALGLQSVITILGKNPSYLSCKEHSFPNVLPVGTPRSVQSLSPFKTNLPYQYQHLKNKSMHDTCWSGKCRFFPVKHESGWVISNYLTALSDSHFSFSRWANTDLQ